MLKINYDVISSIIFIIISIIAIWETKDLSKMSYVFPRTISIILLILSLIYFVVNLVKRHDKKAFGNINKKKVLFVSLSMILYLVGIGLFGFFFASLLYIALLCWYLQNNENGKSKNKKWLNAILSSIIVTVVFYTLFKFVLLVPLPSGVLLGG